MFERLVYPIQQKAHGQSVHLRPRSNPFKQELSKDEEKNMDFISTFKLLNSKI